MRFLASSEATLGHDVLMIFALCALVVGTLCVALWAGLPTDRRSFRDIVRERRILIDTTNLTQVAIVAIALSVVAVMVGNALNELAALLACSAALAAWGGSRHQRTHGAERPSVYLTARVLDGYDAEELDAALEELDDLLDADDMRGLHEALADGRHQSQALGLAARMCVRTRILHDGVVVAPPNVRTVELLRRIAATSVDVVGEMLAAVSTAEAQAAGGAPVGRPAPTPRAAGTAAGNPAGTPAPGPAPTGADPHVDALTHRIEDAHRRMAAGRFLLDDFAYMFAFLAAMYLGAFQVYDAAGEHDRFLQMIDRIDADEIVAEEVRALGGPAANELGWYAEVATQIRTGLVGVEHAATQAWLARLDDYLATNHLTLRPSELVLCHSAIVLGTALIAMGDPSHCLVGAGLVKTRLTTRAAFVREPMTAALLNDLATRLGEAIEGLSA